jgi:hypothetical protein
VWRTRGAGADISFGSPLPNWPRRYGGAAGTPGGIQTRVSERSYRSEAVRRVARIVLLCLTVCLVTGMSESAEEITLKDGKKIVGHLTGVSSDKIEVETSDGTLQLKRGDIVTISFPENSSAKSPEAHSEKRDLPKIDETLSGTQYVNRTGEFSLTLPRDWIIDTDPSHSPSTLAVLSSKDKTRVTFVMQEEYPGSLESYKEVTMLNARRTLGDFEELSESNATIDGKTALLVFYRGVVSKSKDLPFEFLSAIVASGNSYTKITAWCLEPLFHDMQPDFEKIVMSYHSSSRIGPAESRQP